MYQQITIKTLNNQGFKQKQIASQMGCHRNTVKNILEREKPIEKLTRNKASYFDKFKDKIKELLDKNISRLRIHEILEEEYQCEKKYISLCKYIQTNFPKTKEAFFVQNTFPGEEAEVDFGYIGIFPNEKGIMKKHWVFVMTLAYSRKAYYQVTLNQNIQTVIKAHKNAFQAFDGIPKKIKVDNMKTAVIKNNRYDLEFNKNYLEFSNHCSFIIKPCPPRKPNQKGKVESGVKYFKNNFIAGRSFQNTEDLINQARDWMDNKANQRIHGTTKKIPQVIFEKEEKEKLQSLPENEYQFFNRLVRKVKLNSHINFENNYYSVPSILVGKEVIIRFDQKTLRILYQEEEVAFHRISDKIGVYVTQKSHRPKHKSYSKTAYQKKYEDKMESIGEFAHKYFKEIIVQKQSYWNRSIRKILHFKECYGKKAVNLSLKRALRFKATNILTIKNILDKELYLLDEPNNLLSQIKKNETEKHNRDLSYYNQII